MKPTIKYLRRTDLNVEQLIIEVAGADVQQRATIMQLIIDALEMIIKENDAPLQIP